MKKYTAVEEGNNVFSSVWDALEDDPIKQENLKLRSKIMREINVTIDKKMLGQQEIAQILKVTQPRVSALRNGKLNDFRIDTLIDFALRLGLHVSFDIAA